MWLPDAVKFECQKECSDCCTIGGGKVYISAEEAGRIAVYLNHSESDFLDRYTQVEKDEFCLRDGNDEHCIFLHDHICTIYDVRPKQCRTYPFWTENLKSEKRWKIIAKECPGIGKGRTYQRDEIVKIMLGESLNSIKEAKKPAK